jgi:hypothetical protein
MARLGVLFLVFRVLWVYVPAVLLDEGRCYAGLESLVGERERAKARMGGFWERVHRNNGGAGSIQVEGVG